MQESADATMDDKTGLRLLWCLYAPWHKWVKRESLGSVERMTCSCGRMYSLNYSKQTIFSAD